MSVNKYLPHIFVLPEDDANRQIANGFLLDNSLAIRQIQILEEAGGWNQVLERFCAIYAAEMDRCQHRFMVLVIDFDGQADRLKRAKDEIGRNWSHLMDRVFVIGSWSEPESLRQAFGISYESIGLEMARDCREGTDKTWRHKLLQHNATEIDRLRTQIRSILFPSL